ncbi:hypothetical protein BSPWISOXPB_3939 [uncultured Gammaproteobacteria bacterium]|nr:hypothetical protein BSPWISOXPB_3939 [uncultured Gammaproteobacteria bacterium]
MADIIQVKNPRTNRYVKIDRDKGRIFHTKKVMVRMLKYLWQKSVSDYLQSY